MTPDLEVLKKVKSATILLYNALSAEQKQTADSLNRFIIGMRMMGRWEYTSGQELASVGLTEDKG